MLRTLATASVLALGLSGAASAATIFTDNFDLDVQGAPQGTLINWTVFSGSIDVIGTPGAFPWYPSGNQIDLNGDNQGEIRTASLGLVLNKMYTLSFDYGNNKNSNGLEDISFGIGDQLFTFAVNGAIPNLINYTINIVFDGGSDYLTFADTGTLSTGDRGGPVLDNVSLALVPLPAAGLLLIGALGGLALWRRRKTV